MKSRKKKTLGISSEKELPKYVSDMENVKTAAQTTVEEIIEQKTTVSNQMKEERIKELAYYNHLKNPENSELDNWYLAIEQYNNE